MLMVCKDMDSLVLPLAQVFPMALALSMDAGWLDRLTHSRRLLAQGCRDNAAVSSPNIPMSDKDRKPKQFLKRMNSERYTSNPSPTYLVTGTLSGSWKMVESWWSSGLQSQCHTREQDMVGCSSVRPQSVTVFNTLATFLISATKYLTEAN